MKQRRAKNPPAPIPVEVVAETPPGDPRVKVVFIENSPPMVTLDDPHAPLQAARGAFVRLRPPEAMSAAETRSWADQARAVAKAVRVLPTRRSADIAATSSRVDARPVGTIREEVYDLLATAGDFELHGIVEGILSEAEHERR